LQGRFTTRSLLAAGAILLGVGFWVWSLGAEQRAIRRLPHDERIALYQRTLENVRTTCASNDLALGPYCAEQARVLLLFAECDESCRQLAGLQLGR
ncbi:MAG: hypothetical protein ACREJT_13130, partial [Myxococcota bacterium]